jgi:Ni2+-binding GTPase involved in maturation of urease and hydrogenase
VEFDRALALSNIEQVRPGMPVLEVATKTGAGIDAWIEALLARRVALLDSR